MTVPSELLPCSHHEEPFHADRDDVKNAPIFRQRINTQQTKRELERTYKVIT